MRVLAITPIHVGADELARRQRRYDRLAPEGVSVDLVDLPAGAPRRLESAADVERSDALVSAAAQAADPAFHDAVLPDCVLDPGLDGGGPVPLAGILRLSAGYLHAAGRPFAHVTRNPAIRAELERRLALYGYDDLVRGGAVLDLGFEAIADDAAWNAALAAAAPELEAAGATAVINGCSAVDVARAGSLAGRRPDRAGAAAAGDHAVTDTDVLVAGAGAAGLAAALAAAEGGASVILAEARETYLEGSNTAMSTAMVPAGGSRWQAEAGIEDSPARFREDIERKTGGKRGREAVARAHGGRSGAGRVAGRPRGRAARAGHRLRLPRPLPPPLPRGARPGRAHAPAAPARRRARGGGPDHARGAAGAGGGRARRHRRGARRPRGAAGRRGRGGERPGGGAGHQRLRRRSRARRRARAGDRRAACTSAATAAAATRCGSAPRSAPTPRSWTPTRATARSPSRTTCW